MNSQGETMAEVLQFVQEWAKRTDARVLSELRRLKVGVTDELYDSVKSKVLELGASKLRLDMSFLDYGRLRDMGAGPGSVQRGGMPSVASIVAKVETPATNRMLLTGKKKKDQKKKVRRPKKFYSRTVYSRFNALLGIISGSLVEQAVQLTKAQLDPTSATK